MIAVELSCVFEHDLSCSIINYRQLLYSLDMFKFDIIVDNSFCGLLNERIIMNDSFSVDSFAENELKPKWQMVKRLHLLSKYHVVHSHHLLVGLSIFNSQILA